MTPFSFSFFIRTPAGKEPATEELLWQPLLLDAGEPHPTLRVADYFESLAQFVRASVKSLPLQVLSDNHATISCGICSEKLGAFYHVARVEMCAGDRTSSFAVNTAISEAGRQCLEQDVLLLGRLLPEPLRPFVPAVYRCSGIGCEGASQTPFLHLAVEWLEDFHEWHLCSTPPEGAHRFGLWSDNGVQYLTQNEARQLFRQAAEIISLSYDWPRGSFLQQWHHAAGDFILRRSKAGLIDVRLITVRAIRPFPFLSCESEQGRFLSMLLFLLDLSVRARLDKLDGVGETVWLDDFVVQETVAGFLTALAEHRTRIGDGYDCLLPLLANLSPEDLHTLGAPLLASYRNELPAGELEQVHDNFDAHLDALAFWLAKAAGEREATGASANGDEQIALF